MSKFLTLGDEVQADDGKLWYIGTLASYVDGEITLDNPVPLYDEEGGINQKEYHSRQPSLTFKPLAVWKYGPDPRPTFTWHRNDNQPLSVRER